MRRIALAVLFATSCQYDIDEVNGLLDAASNGVQEIQRAAVIPGGATIKLRFLISWNSDIDSAIKYGPSVGNGYQNGAFSPAADYAQPGYNMYVSENPVSPNQPATFSAFVPAPQTVGYKIRTCGHPGGITQETWEFPAFDILPGHTIYIWFMPRCSNGAWPTSGPPESYWRYSITAPNAGGFYNYYAYSSGFYSNKQMWRGWFHGCGGFVDTAWDNGTNIYQSTCFIPNPPSCICDVPVNSIFW